MQTSISKKYQASELGKMANDILRKCVHCGFCTATCPTYQVQGDELDSPRGRIYLIKQVLEGHTASRATQIHLDRCLSCRSCETTCPSGVEYSHLLDIGRKLVDEQVKRPIGQRLLRKFLAYFLNQKFLFELSLKVGRVFRFVLPKTLQRNLSNKASDHKWPTTKQSRVMLLLDGCVQPGLAPNINLVNARVFERLGIELQIIKQAKCCGAVKLHLSETDTALEQMKANIDAWIPSIEAGAETIVINATACASMVKEYGYYLRDDSQYADKAKRVSELAKDISEILADENLSDFAVQAGNKKVAYHPPCTLQHGQGITDVVETILTKIGYELTEISDKHLCCGAAGTYSILQKDISKQLLDKKLSALESQQPDIIVTGNIGCLLHLQCASSVQVKHWIELIDP